MRLRFTLLIAGLLAVTPALAGDVLDYSFRKLAGREQVNLRQAYAGKVLLVVNTASKCGNTPQYEGLEAMYGQYKDKGFAVLGFPSNDFLGQEPGDEKQIAEFCTLTYGVKFPMFEKVQVRGADATPLYRQLAAETGEPPDWNFHKYLIHRDGKTIESFPAKMTPDDPALVAAIRKALAE